MVDSSDHSTITQSVDTCLAAAAAQHLAAREHELRAERVRALTAACAAQRAEVLRERIRVCQARQRLIPKAQSTLAQLLLLQQQRAQRPLALDAAAQLRDRATQLDAAIRARQRRLLYDLSQIYPIAQGSSTSLAYPSSMAGASSSSSGGGGSGNGSGSGAGGPEAGSATGSALSAAAAAAAAPCIRGISLPPLAAHLLGLEDEPTSTAIGYTAHLLVLLAKLWAVPLRYRVICQGSRSVIIDDVAQSEHPLYASGVPADRFEFAWFLLNKNVEMLICARREQLARSRLKAGGDSAGGGGGGGGGGGRGSLTGERGFGGFYQILDSLDYLISQELPR